jgi:transcriptional regulator with XRE-family HTH domain
MMTTRLASKIGPAVGRTGRTLIVEAWRRAEAMGLVKPEQGAFESADLGRLLRRVREAGIARDSALRFDNIEPLSGEEAESMLRLVIRALEASPVPRFEWPAVARVLEAEQLAALLNVSVTSLRRYLSNERETPDEVAARLHHVALIVGDLAGAYNEVGVRRWFGRARTALSGKTPASILSGDWNPDAEAPQQVRELARSLVSLATT